MSSSAQGGSDDRKKEPRGLKKFIRRASLVLKPKSKRQSVSDPSVFAPKDSAVAVPAESTAPSSSTPVAIPPTNTDPATAQSDPAQNTQTVQDNKLAPTPVESHKDLSAKERSALQEEKAKALFTKYGLTLEPAEWKVPVISGAPRMEKQVRVRVHRTCHRCQTTFGQEKLCTNCNHTRCKKCPRFPASKAKVAKDKGTTGGTNYGRRKAGWNCEKCNTLFKDPEKPCDSCGHVRCSTCPRATPSKAETPKEEASVQAVEERMRRLDVSPQAPAA